MSARPFSTLREFTASAGTTGRFHSLPALAEAVVERITDPRVPGILVRRHGLYAWGANPFQAKRHVEAFEFMFEYLLRRWTVGAGLVHARKGDLAEAG